MAMITYPLNDVQYSAEDAGLFHCTRTSGIWVEDSFQISATGADNSISIGTGVGWISNEKFWGKVFALKEAETLDLGIADAVYPRIDVVAVQFDATANETKLIVKNGVPSSTPLMPDIIQTESVYELYLCKVLRPAGSTVVNLSNITDTRLDTVLCGLMADSVTRIDTDSINSQVMALLEELQNELESVKNGTDVMLASEWAADGAIAIEKGGTDATTSEQARKNIGAMGGELLWTNANSNSNFSPQTISLSAMGLSSLTDYAYIIVQFVVSAGASTHQCSAPIFRSTGKYSTQYQNSSGAELRRLVSATVGGGVEFEAGKRDDTTDNSVMIPEKIYGFKL